MRKLIITLFSGLCLILALNPAFAQVTEFGMIKGTILTINGDALSEAQVCLYRVESGSPFRREYWRMCDFFSRTGADGSFSEIIPAGEYYMLATKKLSGENPGPPIDAGDPTWPAWDSREIKTYMVTSEGATNIGVISGAVPFKEEWLPAGKTAIEGKVLLKDGTPAEGVLVYASTDPQIQNLVYISDRRTGFDGKYIVRVDEDGEYYVRAVGASKPVEKATVQMGEVTRGIDIRVKENPSSRWDRTKEDKKQQ
ncbi:MAG: carboxypeptidase regulatory-like domain-containing protein [Nitrospiraceae bacterium]|nr:MAG: carboxypeptidase regulatory-like domain-containing protein [Nitrospiraceae bacterium]